MGTSNKSAGTLLKVIAHDLTYLWAHISIEPNFMVVIKMKLLLFSNNIPKAHSIPRIPQIILFVPFSTTEMREITCINVNLSYLQISQWKMS